jgi:hypothetical protein
VKTAEKILFDDGGFLYSSIRLMHLPLAIATGRNNSDLFDFQNCDGRFDPMKPGRAQDGSKIIQRIQSILVTLYVLEFVGATAVTSLGWSASRILKIDWTPSGPL